MLKKWRGGRINRRSLKWGGILMALVMVFSVTFGILGTKETKALPGDPSYWSAESWGDLSVTVVTVEQYGVEIAPVWDDYLFNEDANEFGNYYIPVANTGDTVRMGVLVDGMQEESTYKIFEDRTLTSEDNGTVVYEDVKPELYSWEMGDGIDCPGEGQPCSYMDLIN